MFLEKSDREKKGGDPSEKKKERAFDPGVVRWVVKEKVKWDEEVLELARRRGW